MLWDYLKSIISYKEKLKRENKNKTKKKCPFFIEYHQRRTEDKQFVENMGILKAIVNPSWSNGRTDKETHPLLGLVCFINTADSAYE